MSTSRRDFLKTTIIVDASAALPTLPTLAASTGGAPTLHLAQGQPFNLPAENVTGYTRGVGVFPGAPHQNFAPNLVIDSSSFRNLALLWRAYHSSSYDHT